jgi:hypothetical protein
MKVARNASALITAPRGNDLDAAYSALSRAPGSAGAAEVPGGLLALARALARSAAQEAFPSADRPLAAISTPSQPSRDSEEQP